MNEAQPRIRRKDMYQNPFSELIIEQKKKLNLTDEWICNVMNCHITSLKKWENGDYLPNKHDKVVKFAHLLQIDLITFDRMFRELQQERAARLPVTPAAPLVETKSALSDDEIEELVNSADRYILFTKKQVVKLIKQVEVKHGLRSDIE